MTLPLYDDHLKNRARMTDFHGYLLPLSFTSILEEAAAVREAAGLFDISHMGHFRVSGSGAREAMNRLVTSDLDNVPPGKSLYGLLLDSGAGVVDDLILSATETGPGAHKGDGPVHMIVNAGNRSGDLAWIRANLPPGLEVSDLSSGQIALAVQGPASARCVSALDGNYETMSRREVRIEPGPDGDLWISRTGYTGEDGWEFFGPKDRVYRIYLRLSAAGPSVGMVHAGLGARDLLRLEMGYSLYGQELTLDRTPFDAGLDFAVNSRKGDFVGREALFRKREDPARARLSPFVLRERGIPRTHCRILRQGSEEPVGEVTSGGFSPRVGGGFGLAYLDPVFARAFEAGAEADLEIHGKRHRAVYHPRPFVSSGLSPTPVPGTKP